MSASLFHVTEMQAASMSSEAHRDRVYVVYLEAGMRGLARKSTCKSGKKNLESRLDVRYRKKGSHF